MTPLMAALDGARQIGFTVVSISISLIAAFIPLLFMDGVVGRLFREFSVTLAFAIMVSTVVSLTVTPMICAHFVRKPPSPDATWFDRLVERRAGAGSLRATAARLAVVLRLPRSDAAGHGWLRSCSPAILYVQHAEGLLPAGRHRPDLRRHARFDRHLVSRPCTTCSRRPRRSCCADPAVAGVGSSVGSVGLERRRSTAGRCSSASSRSPNAAASPPRPWSTRLRQKARQYSGPDGVLRSPRRTSGSAAGRATPPISITLWDARLSTNCWNGRRRCWRRLRSVPGLVDVSTRPRAGRPAGRYR